MATRIGDVARAKIESAWPTLIGALCVGESIEALCELAGIRPDSIRAYRLENPDRDREWQLAREHRADWCAEQVMVIANNPGADSGCARVRMDAYRWLAAKYWPKQYNDKQQIDMNVRSIDLAQIISAAAARLAAQRVVHEVPLQLADIL